MTDQPQRKLKFDVVVIGGGAAGMMAAISAKRHHPDYSVALIDRTFALGRKILICGAGRCNITNINLNDSVAKHYYGASPEFISTVFKQFSYEQIVAFFNDLGVELYVERKTDIGKLFPVTDQAKTITALLEDELARSGVEIFLNTEVKEIKKNGGWELRTKAVGRDSLGTSGDFSCQYLILSAGGQTYPALGSNGSGYDLTKSLGHKLISPIPSALPLEAKNQLCHLLQGTKLEVEVTTIINGREIKTRTDDVMFTKYGLSGPAILNISREVSIYFNREHKQADAWVKLNFFPGKNKNEAGEILKLRWEKRPEQTIEKSLYGLFPNKVPGALLQTLDINLNTLVKDLRPEQTEKLLTALAETKIKITGTKGWNEAEFTAGGVDTIEVQAESLESKLHKNLYFAGEILDVDGDVGGFNLSWSWSSGYVAGKLQ